MQRSTFYLKALLKPFHFPKMSLFKTLLRSNQIKLLFKTQNPPQKHFPSSQSFIIRTLNSCPQEPTKKPLSLLFEEAVGLTEKVGGGDNQGRSQDEKDGLMSELRQLEFDIREFKETPKPKRAKEDRVGVETEIRNKVNNLVGLFRSETKEAKVEKKAKPRRETGVGDKKKEEKLEKRVIPRRRESGEAIVLKELSVFVNVFVRHLYSKGYFNKANFLVSDELDFCCFDNNYARDFIKSAAYQFGKDNQEIAVWLSGDHLKKVVLFGCPSLDKINIFAAKRLRKILKIQEDTVCSQCMLKDSCKFANQGVWGIGTNVLLLVDVMKVIILYNLDQVPPELIVPDEVRDSADKLLEKKIKLSQTKNTRQGF